jgi:phosphoribosyl 1,2-cyclic phosphodiesterase
MSLSISSLNSGSNGNCYYIGNNTDAIFIDAGITCRETEKRMARLGLDFLKIKAIFISHEHSDHINGILAISRKYKIPVYITEQTLISCKLKISSDLVHYFNTNEAIQIGSLNIFPFLKNHDAADPHSFTITSSGITVGVFTDIGNACKRVIENFKRCHAVFLETNYDEELLEKGHYPYHLKRRIKSDLGHLSNLQALELVLKHKSKFLSQILLSHLSRDNNKPELVLELFQKNIKNIAVSVASRDVETEIFKISQSPHYKVQVKQRPIQVEQLSLF